MRILVTGSSGRVGRAVYVRLLRDGHDVRGLDRSPASTADVVGDIRDPELLRCALEDIDAVVHTAALHAPHVGHVDEALFHQVNVEATVVLARLAIDRGIKRLVFTSTTALYGDAATPPGRAGWVDESVEPRPRTVYHRTKLAAEAFLESLSREAKLGVTVLRMSRCFPEPAPCMAMYRLHRGIDVRDVAEAHALALDGHTAGFRRLVISGGTPFRPEDVVKLQRDAPAVLARRAPALVEAFRSRQWRLTPSLDRVYSPALAMLQLGWRPRYGFLEVLKMLDEGSPEVLPAREQDLAEGAAASHVRKTGGAALAGRSPRRRISLAMLSARDEADFLAAARASRRLHGSWVTPPDTPSKFRALLARMDGKSNLGLLARRRDSGAPVGFIEITNIVHGSFRSAYLGYYAFSGHERQGLMRESMKLAVRKAFTEMKLHRLEANIQPANGASIALVKACGFSREGYSPRYLKIRGRWRDHERWAILAS